MPAGRPSKLDAVILQKLEQVFAMDASIDEACFYAEISPQTYYNWIEKEPKLLERFNALRNKPILKARTTFIKALDDPQYAVLYLERKRKKEFSPRQELTGSEGNDLTIKLVNYNGDNNPT